jgi:hypothetical protein
VGQSGVGHPANGVGFTSGREICWIRTETEAATNLDYRLPLTVRADFVGRLSAPAQRSVSRTQTISSTLAQHASVGSIGSRLRPRRDSRYGSTIVSPIFGRRCLRLIGPSRCVKSRAHSALRNTIWHPRQLSVNRFLVAFTGLDDSRGASGRSRLSWDPSPRAGRRGAFRSPPG